MKYVKQITLGYQADGKPYRKRIYANSKAELDRNIHKALSEYELIKNPSNITFKKYAERWMETYKASREAATIEMYQNALRKTDSIDYMRMKDIRLSDLQKILANNFDHPNACAKIRLTFAQIWACALQDGIISDDFTKRLETPKMKVTEGRALTDEEKSAIKAAELTDEERIYIYLLFYLGLRPQEALALTPEDFNGDTVTIQRAVGYQGNKPYIKTTKTMNIRVMPIPDDFQPFLDYYLSQLKQPYLLGRNNNIMSKTVKSDLWLSIKKKIEDKLGYETDLHPYVFRHNYCTMCFYSGISLKKCQYLMGHSSVQMIMKIYTHLDDSKEPLDKLKSMKF